MDSSSKIREALDRLPSQEGKSLQDVMDAYPFMERVAARKWVYLKSHGYVSDRMSKDGNGILIYKQSNPKVVGKLDWWGKVTWFKEE